MRRTLQNRERAGGIGDETVAGIPVSRGMHAAV
jgi:hypothetical protein